MLCAAFFPRAAAFVMIALYVIGIAIALLAAFIFKKTAFKGEPCPLSWSAQLPYSLPPRACFG